MQETGSGSHQNGVLMRTRFDKTYMIFKLGGGFRSSVNNLRWYLLMKLQMVAFGFQSDLYSRNPSVVCSLCVYPSLQCQFYFLLSETDRSRLT